jgi:hypothetical protein
VLLPTAVDSVAAVVAVDRSSGEQEKEKEDGERRRRPSGEERERRHRPPGEKETGEGERHGVEMIGAIFLMCLFF